MTSKECKVEETTGVHSSALIGPGQMLQKLKPAGGPTLAILLWKERHTIRFLHVEKTSYGVACL